MTQAITDQLASLGPLSEKEKQAIAKAGNLITVPQSWAPMHEGTPADKVYLILEGEVSVRKNGVEVARLGPGETVGETALALRRLRNATVVSLTPLRVLHFTKHSWERLVASIPTLSAAVEERAALRA